MLNRPQNCAKKYPKDGGGMKQPQNVASLVADCGAVGHGSRQVQAHVRPACAAMSNCTVLVPFAAMFGDCLRPLFFHSLTSYFWNLCTIFRVIVCPL